VAQESLTNIEKHARASRVSIHLSLPSDEVRLFVEDNGAGFNPQLPFSPGHYGLAGMRERVEGMGGTLAIHSLPGRGARLEVHIPTLEKSH
jgi:signal transduction histidine kinase